MTDRIAHLTRDGFPGQRLRVLPRPLIGSALRQGPTSRMLVTDVGYFPRAANHGRRRSKGSPGAVVILCVGGLGWCEIADRTQAIRASQALVIPAHVPHLYWADTTTPWTIWWMHMAGDDVSELLGALVRDHDEAVVRVRDMPRAVTHVERALECLERDETMPNLLEAAGAAWGLLSQLVADSIAGVGARGEPVRDAQEYLREHLADHLSVPDLARRAGLSVSHFAALFRAATGSGVVEYLKRLRMARARELLMTTSWTIEEIARAVGYSDPFYFSRQFHAVNGCSPSRYRDTDEDPWRRGPS